MDPMGMPIMMMGGPMGGFGPMGMRPPMDMMGGFGGFGGFEGDFGGMQVIAASARGLAQSSERWCIRAVGLAVSHLISPGQCHAWP